MYITIDTNFLQHPKFKILCRRLDDVYVDVVKTSQLRHTTSLGVIVRLWVKTMQFYRDGKLDYQAIFDVADESGLDAEKLKNALIESGLIEEVDGYYLVHDWYDYGGKYNRTKELYNERQKRYRENKKKDDENVTSQ